VARVVVNERVAIPDCLFQAPVKGVSTRPITGRFGQAVLDDLAEGANVLTHCARPDRLTV
jgi:hypothetical protein